MKKEKDVLVEKLIEQMEKELLDNLELLDDDDLMTLKNSYEEHLMRCAKEVQKTQEKLTLLESEMSKRGISLIEN